MEPAKTPKTKATKLKLTTPKVPESSGKKKTPKPKSTTKKAAAKASGSDDEMMVDTPMVEEKPLTPAEAKEKKEKESKPLQSCCMDRQADILSPLLST